MKVQIEVSYHPANEAKVEFLFQAGLFAFKAAVIVGSLSVVLILAFQLGSRGRRAPQLEIEKLNTRFKNFRRALQSQLLAKGDFKSLLKAEKKVSKRESEPRPTRIFVLDFHGDLRASAVESLREETTAILSIAKPGDEVLLRLESGGGLVTSYGLAAAQLTRLKSHGVRLTVAVDKIAASGGYMMACVADKILAAPFAVLGSIGVIAQVPNFHRLLDRHDIDYKEVTAGEFKRTVSIFAEITEPGMRKFKEQIEDTHSLFKNFVVAHRPKINIDQVATGEYWYGRRAEEHGLVDELLTSDEYLFKSYDVADIFRVQYNAPKKWMDRISESAGQALQNLLLRVWGELDRKRFGA